MVNPRSSTQKFPNTQHDYNQQPQGIAQVVGTRHPKNHYHKMILPFDEFFDKFVNNLKNEAEKITNKMELPKGSY